jgi:predicted nucleic acid-binding protein
MSKKPAEPLILLDSDVFRHFQNGGLIFQLKNIYPGRFVMLDKVKNELCESRQLVDPVNNFIAATGLTVMPFPSEKAIMKEYATLIKEFGVGESACMAVAKHHKHYIASSNLKDISKYCQENGIVYYTTMDILLEGHNKRLYSEQDCNEFITNVITKGSKLPCKTIQEYILKYKK